MSRYVFHSTLSPEAVAFAWREGMRVSSVGCLGGLARRPHHVSSLVISGSVISGLPQSSMPIRTSQVPLLQEPSTAVVQVCCGTVISSRPSHLIIVYLVTPRFPSIETLHLYISEPLSAARDHYSTRTTIIFVCVDSSIQALAAKHAVFNLLPVTCPHAHNMHITGLVTASATIVLAGSPAGVAI